MEDVNLQESWNKKRIFIGIAILTLLVFGGYALKTFVLGKSQDNSPSKTNPLSSILQSVKGTRTEENKPVDNVSLPHASDIQKALQQKLEAVKQEITHINVADIASSSGEIQKIINDLNALRQYPVKEVKDVCWKICRGL